MPGKRNPKKFRIPIRRGAGKRIAELKALYEEAHARMTPLVIKGRVEASVLAQMTAFIEDLERFAIRLKIWELGGCKGDLPPMPKSPDFAALIPGYPGKPRSVLHVH